MTQELIKITENGQGKKVTSARDLYEFLEIKKHITQWLKPYIKEDNEYGFLEDVDFTRIDGEVNPTNGIPIQEFILTIDMAKELSMLSKSKKGKEARQYFIDCENKLKEVISISREQQLVLSIYNGGVEAIESVKELTQLKVSEAVKPLNEKIEQDKPLVEFSNQILKSADNILIRELAKIISDEVTKIGQNRLYDKLREWKMIMKSSTEPYQTYIENGYFVVEEKSVKTAYNTKLTKTTKCTPKGQVAIVEKFRKEFSKK